MKALKKVLAFVLALTLMIGCTLTVCAEGPYGLEGHFDFPKYELNLAKGDVYTMNFFCDTEDRVALPTYSVYVVGRTSKKTYVTYNDKIGNTSVEIHVGEDETSTKFTLYFYIDATDNYDTVNVHIVDPIKSDKPETKKAATYAAMGLDPKTGKPIKK